MTENLEWIGVTAPTLESFEKQTSVKCRSRAISSIAALLEHVRRMCGALFLSSNVTLQGLVGWLTFADIIVPGNVGDVSAGEALRQSAPCTCTPWYEFWVTWAMPKGSLTHYLRWER